MTNLPVSKRAQELAREHYPEGTPGYRLITMLLEQYGRDVREAAAEISPNSLHIGASAYPHEVWGKFRNAIREMDLP